jgi:NAD(P)H-flavin reductase
VSADRPATDVGVVDPAGREDPYRLRPFTVASRRRDTHDTWTVTLEPGDGGALPFAPGQFTMVHALPVGEAPISISGDPARPERLEHTVRDVGSVTHAITHAEPGQVLGLRGAFGTGWEVASARGGDLVVVAGGIGLAPLRPALVQVCAMRAEFERVVLLYGARTPEEILYPADLRRWADRHDVDVQVTVDNGQQGWDGRVGLVTQLVARASFDPVRTTALVCGPEVMMRYAAVSLTARGVPSSRVRLSMERSMTCGVGLCGHCQLRELFVCLDGPVLSWERLEPLVTTAEL